MGVCIHVTVCVLPCSDIARYMHALGQVCTHFETYRMQQFVFCHVAKNAWDMGVQRDTLMA